MSISFQHVSFAYPGNASPIFEDVTVHFAEGWTGIVGANGAGKTTFLQLAMGQIEAQTGTIKRKGSMVFCPQRTDDMPENLPRFVSATDAEAWVLRGELQVEENWATRWPTLSHGERKRAQIGVALWQRPDVLLLDEPTNHIDLIARELLVATLSSFNGIGLLVSHDRDLLDLLCQRCIFLDPPEVVVRPGNYSKAVSDAQREESSLIARREILQQNLERLKIESRRRYEKASRAGRRSSKRNLARGDSDGRARIDLARVSGQDGQAGRLARQPESRIARLHEKISGIKIKKRYDTYFWLEGSVSPRKCIFSIAGEIIDLDGQRRLKVPEFSIMREDRIAITGENGLGKSTFVRFILDRMDLPGERLVFLPQEIDLAQTRKIMEDVHRLSREQLGTVMTVVSALGSRPERLLNNLDASPGELRKVLLALGVIRHPYLIVMDEPTNHLDIPAIQCLEDALMGCPCALLLISHDLRFLSRVALKRWHLQQHGREITFAVKELERTGY